MAGKAHLSRWFTHVGHKLSLIVPRQPQKLTPKKALRKQGAYTLTHSRPFSISPRAQATDIKSPLKNYVRHGVLDSCWGVWLCAKRSRLGRRQFVHSEKKWLRYLQNEFIGKLPEQRNKSFYGTKNPFSGIILSHFKDHCYIFINIIIFSLTKKYLINTNINTIKSQIIYITMIIHNIHNTIFRNKQSCNRNYIYLFKNLLLYIKDPFNIVFNCKFL